MPPTHRTAQFLYLAPCLLALCLKLQYLLHKLLRRNAVTIQVVYEIPLSKPLAPNGAVRHTDMVPSLKWVVNHISTTVPPKLIVMYFFWFSDKIFHYFDIKFDTFWYSLLDFWQFLIQKHKMRQNIGNPIHTCTCNEEWFEWRASVKYLKLIILNNLFYFVLFCFCFCFCFCFFL